MLQCLNTDSDAEMSKFGFAGAYRFSSDEHFLCSGNRDADAD